MLDFCIVNMGDYNFRCVLSEETYFDFSVSQLELFGYDYFFSHMQRGVGGALYEVETGRSIGDVVSIRYLKPKDEIWVLVRNGIRGELYAKHLGG